MLENRMFVVCNVVFVFLVVQTFNFFCTMAVNPV